MTRSFLAAARAACLAACLAAAPLSAVAHEFWIEPEDYTVAQGEEIVADILVGENFRGTTYAFNPRSFTRFDYRQGEARGDVPGRAGDRPALRMTAPGNGLVVIAQETRAQALTYDEMATFEEFLAHKDWTGLRAEHDRRGLPETGFRERYTRHAKSLVAVGDGRGSDRALGLQTEIVALENPYTSGADRLPVRVLLEGAPRADAQVELYAKAPDGTVRVSRHRTNARGIASLPVSPGHSYLVDAVVIRAKAPSETDSTVWESLWAGLTFAVPSR